MQMEYKLLCDKTGVILTRQPELVTDKLFITFTGAPEGATAVFERDDGNSMYRLIEGEICSLDAAFLRGTIKCAVAMLNGSVKTQKWLCEGIKTVRIKDVGVIVSPDDVNLQNKLVKIQIEKAALQNTVDKHEERISELEKKLTKLLEGYDIV